VSLIVLTRDTTGNQAWRAQLERHGAGIYELPCLETLASSPTPDIQAAFDRIHEFSWLVFPNPTSVQYFMELATELGHGLRSFTGAWIAAHDHGTADVIKSLGLVVNFVPSRPDGAILGRELKRVKSRHILVVRSTPGEHPATSILRGRSSQVTDLPVFQTRPVTTPDLDFHDLIRAGHIAHIVFASPSSVVGFLHRVTDQVALELARTAPVVAIGEATVEALTQAGFRNVIVAEQPSVRSILQTA
jgi:uroporphyrinogen III methyltransferase/synthase